MKQLLRKLLGLLLALFMGTPALNATANTGNPVPANVSESRIYVDGREARLTGFTIGGSTYFKLRDVAEALSETPSGFDVIWNAKGNAVEFITDKPYTEQKSGAYTYYYAPSIEYTAQPGTSKLIVDGEPVAPIAYVIDGSNYFKLRDLGAYAHFDVEFSEESDEIHIYSRLPENAHRVKAAGNVADNILTPYYPRWQSPLTSNLIRNDDGTFSVIEANDEIVIDTYDEDFQLISSKKIPPELPLFGGFYSGKSYHYIAYGQENPEENDEAEVIRIVRYDKEFNRIDSVSIQGGASYTTIPFAHGSGRMAESGNTLVFHTSRQRYMTEDGLNHQSQLTIMIDTSTMSVTNSLGKFQPNHVSHSFDQYVLFDGNEHVLLDHGDAYPRSIVLQKGNGVSYREVDMFEIPGKIGANMTGVSVGGFAESSSHYIVAMNTIDHALVTEYTSFEMKGLERDQRDILIAAVPKNNLNGNEVKVVTIAEYIDSDKLASIPRLVRVNDDKHIVLWQEFDKFGELYSQNRRSDLKYVFLDKGGRPSGGIQTVERLALSRCNPIVIGDKVVWYAQENGIRIFYAVPLIDQA
ncbi:hypothetical protein [Cohnella massiliensis]|uniref:hypothetical protein n=1 Tax=Cohnella massiliensis TaxID=1816691 RepID=UPI0011182A83|nr:hypothetical protein [Cohnella massiliensis]